MATEKPLVNRVAASGLITLKLESWLSNESPINIDIKDYLFQGLILKEKDFRAELKEYDWTRCQDKIVTVHCSSDAIVPQWAYLLIAVHAAPYAQEVYPGSPSDWQQHALLHRINTMDLTPYQDKRVVIKGCSDVAIDIAAYTRLAARLQPIVKSLMYGEPCSTVPLFKRK